LLQRDPTAGVDRCLHLAADGQDREAVAALKSVRGPAVDRLFARLDDSNVDVRLAAAHLLGKVDGPAVTERLAEMVDENRHRREALAALMQSDGPEARQFIAQAQATRDLEAVVRSLAIQLKSF
jgi:HEAT repeat protein